MALFKGTNAYATVLEADAYFADRLDSTAWSSAADTRKSQALITAAKLLEDIRWVGTAISESQPLAFPRNGEFFDPRLGILVSLDNVTVPTRIVQANYELALHLLTNESVLDDTGSVTNISVDTISLSRVVAPAVIPHSVKTIIRPLQLNQGANLWYRSN